MAHDRPLTEKARRLLAGSDTHRRAAFAPGGILVSYPEAVQVMEVLDEILQQPSSRRPLNLLVTAASGNGKSSIVETFSARWPRRDNRDEQAIEVPIIKVDAPSTKRLMTLYVKLLEQLNAPNIRSIRTAEDVFGIGSRAIRQPQIAAQAVLQLLKLCKVRMVIIDEIHSLSRENNQYAKTTLDWIKSIPNETGIPIVLCGEVAAKNIALDPQLANRFDECTLPDWQNDVRTTQLLADLEAAIPLRKPSNLRSGDIARFLVAHCNGTIGSMVRLIEKAGRRAVGAEERITLEALQRAVKDGCRTRLEDFGKRAA